MAWSRPREPGLRQASTQHVEQIAEVVGPGRHRPALVLRQRGRALAALGQFVQQGLVVGDQHPVGFERPLSAVGMPSMTPARSSVSAAAVAVAFA
jgi:hypothetical protein